MKPSNNENEVASTMKSIAKYAFVAPRAIAKGRGRGLKSLSSLRVSRTISPFSSSTDHIMQCNQIAEISDQGKEQGLKDVSYFENAENEEEFLHQNTNYASQSMTRGSNSTIFDSTTFAAKGLQTLNKRKLIHEKEYMQVDIPISPFTNQVMKSTQTVGISALGKGRGQIRSMCSSEVSKNEDGSCNQNTHLPSQSISTTSNSTKSNSVIFATQGLRTKKKRPLVPEKEHVQADIPISPSTDQVMQSTQSAGTSSKISEKVRKGRRSNKCKEVASLEVGQKLKVTFYNNRTVGKNSNLFSRYSP